MAMKQSLKQSFLKRPLLVGGLGASASLWLLESAHVAWFDGSTLLSALALGSGLWWWRYRQPSAPVSPKPVAPPVVDRARVEAQLEHLRELLATLGEEAALVPNSASVLPPSLQAQLATYEAQRQALATALDRTHLQGVLMGDRRGGKTTLLQYLANPARPQAGAPPHTPNAPLLTSAGTTAITWTEVVPSSVAPGLASITPQSADWSLAEDAKNSAPVSDLKSTLQARADLPATLDTHGHRLAEHQATEHQADVVLWVTEGDLTASALDQIRARVVAGQGVVIVFNKTDLALPADRQTVLAQLQRQGDNLPGPVAVVAVAAAPRPITVRRHQADGSVVEFQEAIPPELADLDVALTALWPQAPTLVAATTLRQAETLRLRLQQDLNQVRRRRAMPMIDQLQWVAGAAAFANPVPTLDVLATLAINGQLILDLGKLYGVTLSLEEAKAAATTLAGLTVKLGLVELSTQVLTAVLKSHFATYLVGGMVQGLSAAYLTRMVGLSLIEHFEQAALAGTPSQALAWDTIAQRLPTIIQQNRHIALLQTLVQQGIGILRPAPALLTANAQIPVALRPTDPLEAEIVPGQSSMNKP